MTNAKPTPKRKPRRKTRCDPVQILEQIAADESVAPTPRVSACQALLRYRLALAGATEPQEAPIVPERRDDRTLVWAKEGGNA